MKGLAKSTPWQIRLSKIDLTSEPRHVPLSCVFSTVTGHSNKTNKLFLIDFNASGFNGSKTIQHAVILVFLKRKTVLGPFFKLEIDECRVHKSPQYYL